MFRYAADRAPIAVISLVFAIDLVVYALVDSPLWLFAWTVLGIVPKGNICAWNHHHQHVATFKWDGLNRVLELVYGLQTGATSMCWMLHHTLGHHKNYLDQDKDESRWMDTDGKPMGVVFYTLHTALTAYPRAWVVGRDYPKIRRTFAWMGLLTMVVLGGLVALRPLPALFVFVIPMVISLLITTWATHSHHTGNSTETHYVASNNIIHRGYNIVTGNLGYHTAHHYKPGVHWSMLPELHAKIEPKIPDDCYLTPGFPWTLGQSDAPSPKPAIEEETEGPRRRRPFGWLLALLRPAR